MNTPIQIDVQEVPEHAEAEEPALVGFGHEAALRCTCDHQDHGEPDRYPSVTCRPWVPTRVKKAERKALRMRGRTLVDQVGELVEFDAQEGEAEQAGDREPDQGLARAR